MTSLRKHRFVVFLAALACLASPLAIARGDQSAASAEAQRLFTARNLTGATVALDVTNGATLAAFSSESTADFLPLSTVKILLAAVYLEHRAKLPSSIAFDPHQLIALGIDSAGRQLALALRKPLGSELILSDLARFGFPACDVQRRTDCTSLSPQTPDAAWADALSIGESQFQVTLAGLAKFFAAIANGGLSPGGEARRILRPETASDLRSALLDSVRTGTATGIRDRLGSLGTIGGKTGTGIAGIQPYDGIFAAIAFHAAGAPKFAIATYVRRGGFGAGAAAEISADLAKFLLSSSTSR